MIIRVLPLCAAFCLALLLPACTDKGPAVDPQAQKHVVSLQPLPPPQPDGGPFGVDANINMNTIDNFLGRPDVAYIDVRMFFDPADYEAIGGFSRLTRTLPGYRIVPFPFIARYERHRIVINDDPHVRCWNVFDDTFRSFRPQSVQPVPRAHGKDVLAVGYDVPYLAGVLAL